MILIEHKKLFKFLRLVLKSVSDCFMKNVIYNDFISPTCQVCITLMLFEELYKITGLSGNFSDL